MLNDSSKPKKQSKPRQAHVNELALQPKKPTKQSAKQATKPKAKDDLLDAIGHTFKLDNYEGSLNNLINLVKEKSIEILSIETTKLARQIADYAKQPSSLIDESIDYVWAAAYLMEIKARYLLPLESIDIEIGQDESIDREKFVASLLEIQKYRNAANMLRAAHDSRAKSIDKMPDDAVFGTAKGKIFQHVSTKNQLDPSLLFAAAKNLIERIRIERPTNARIRSKHISLSERQAQIEKFLEENIGKEISLIEFFTQSDKYFIAITLLSLLVIAKDVNIEIYQDGEFEMIYVKYFGKGNGHEQ